MIHQALTNTDSLMFLQLRWTLQDLNNFNDLKDNALKILVSNYMIHYYFKYRE